MDPREVNTGEKGKEREDNETEMGVRGKVGFIEPLTEGIGARTRRRRGKGRGKESVGVKGRQEGKGGPVRVSKGGKGEGRGRMGREDRGKGEDARTGFGDGFPPRLHGVSGGGDWVGSGGGRGGGRVVVVPVVVVQVHGVDCKRLFGQGNAGSTFMRRDNLAVDTIWALENIVFSF